VILLTLRDLQFRSMRFLIAVFGTGLVFSMVLMMSGMSAHFRREPERTISAVGAEVWVVKEGVKGPFSSTATLPASLADDLRAQGADAADAVAIVRHAADVDGDSKDVMLFGHRRGGLGEPRLVSGRAATGRGELVATVESGLKTGASTDVGGMAFQVTGLTEQMTLMGTPMLFVDIADAQELVFAGQPVATTVLAKGTVPQLPGTRPMTEAEAVADALRPMEQAVGAIDIMLALLWAVAASIIGAVVYLSALERARDFAVLKATGARNRALLFSLAVQSTLSAVLAAFLAMALSIGLVPMFPIPMTIPVSAYVQLPLLALAAGLLASLGGLRKAVGVDPALAFSGPGG
jgi:putative ABC transport system permease protein